MALKAKLATLDGLNEAVQAEYTKGDDGQFYLDVQGVDDMPAVAGLRRKNTELMDEVKGVKRVLKRHELIEDRIVEDDLDAALGGLKEKATKKPEGGDKKLEDARKEWEAEKAAISTNAQKEVAKAKEEAAAELEAARNYFLDGEVTRAVAAQKGVPELLGHIIRGHLDVQRGEDGRFSLRVLGADKQPRIKDSAGNPFTLDDLVGELKADPKFGRAFESSGTTGGGATQPAPGGGAATNPWKKESRNLTEQGRILKEDPAKAKQLAAQAGVKL